MLLRHCQRLLRQITPNIQRRLFSCNRAALCKASSTTEVAKKYSDDALTSSKEYLDNVERFKDISDPDLNWLQHGYDNYDRENDEFMHNGVLFIIVTCVFIGGGFILAYMPDNKMVSWTQREAYLELARREANGLPLIDPNLVPPEKMKKYLPTDEELGDTEIII